MERKILNLLCMVALSIPVAAQTRFDTEQLLRDLEVLSSDEYEGREAGTPGGEKAREYLEAGFHSLGLERCYNTYHQVFHINGSLSQPIVAANVVGLVPGSELPEKYIVVTAHYDHVGIRGDRIFNGADDNASGAAALLALASYFVDNPARHSIVFAALDAEEKGLLGARAFLDEPCVDQDRIAINVNLDMISRSDSLELYASGTYHNPALKEILDGIDTDRNFALRFGHDEPGTGRDDWTMSSDHGPFHRAGIPFVYFGVEDHAGYHRPTDDFEFITADFYIDVVDAIIDSISRMSEKMEIIDRMRDEE